MICFFFFVSEHLLGHIRDATIQAGYRTDHCQIHLTLEALNQQRGPGLWKFNDSLLKDENYSTLIHLYIVDTIQRYAVPIYSKEFTSNPCNFSELQFTINISLFYETLLMLIRGETVKYSKNKARKIRAEEEAANKEITRLREVFDKSRADVDMSNLLDAQEKLQKNERA